MIRKAGNESATSVLVALTGLPPMNEIAILPPSSTSSSFPENPCERRR